MLDNNKKQLKKELRKQLKEKIRKTEGRIFLTKYIIFATVFTGLFVISNLLFDTMLATELEDNPSLVINVGIIALACLWFFKKVLKENEEEYIRVLGKPHNLDFENM